jgi:hypothetical protein
MPHYTLTLSGRWALALASLCVCAGFILGSIV